MTPKVIVIAQVRALTKEPRGKEVNDGDVFSFNADFTAQLYRIKINNIQVLPMAPDSIPLLFCSYSLGRCPIVGT